MRWIDSLRTRFHMLTHRKQAATQLDAELQFHIEQETEENLAAGMSPSAARSAAMRTFGNPLLLREQSRATWKWTAAELFLHDIAYGFRKLARSPGFSCTVVLIMALGVGAVVALFTVVNAVLLRPLPFPQQDRLVRIYEASAQGNHINEQVAGGTYDRWKRYNRSFSEIAIAAPWESTLSTNSGQLPERIDTEIGSANLLATFGVKPLLGRLFTAADDRQGATRTTILTRSLWQRRFTGDPSILGKTIHLDGQPVIVVGVLPKWFIYPSSKQQLWTCVTTTFPAEYQAALHSDNAHNFNVIGRLKTGISPAPAQAELAAISAQRFREAPGAFVFDSAYIRPLLDSQTLRVRTSIYTLFAATGCLLFIACLNITNLLIARSVLTMREGAIRAALGSSRARRVRVQIIESLLLSIAGSFLGSALAYAAIFWFKHANIDLPRIESVRIDSTSLLCALFIASLCGLIAGLVPSLTTQDSTLLRSLREGSRSHSSGRSAIRLRTTLIAVEIAFTVVLLIGSGLLIKTHAHLTSVNYGCDPSHLLTMNISLAGDRYKQPITKIAFWEGLVVNVRSIPGVTDAGIATALPGSGAGEDDGYSIHEDPQVPLGKSLDADVRWIDPNYFNTMKIPLIRGRLFVPQQRDEQTRYVLISQSLANHRFAGRDPIGKHIDDDNNAAPGAHASNEIIGIVGDVRPDAQNEPVDTNYFPIYNGQIGAAYLVVRTQGDPLAYSLRIQKLIASVDPNLAVSEILPLSAVMHQSVADTSFQATLFLVFAITSLVLAAVGLFGVLSFVVATRTNELGIRIALGAQREQILWMVLRDGLRPAILGTVTGLAASAALSRLITSMLYGTQPLDMEVFAIVIATLLSVAAAASLLPAWRASHLDLIETLRLE